MNHCEIEEETILVYLGRNDINREVVDIVTYDTFWDSFDFHLIPLPSLLKIAKNIVLINRSRRQLYNQNPRHEENDILWETFARISTKINKIFDDALAVMDNINDTDAFQNWFFTSIEPQRNAYANLLKAQLSRLDPSLIGENIVTKLRQHCAEYEKSVCDSMMDTVVARNGYYDTVQITLDDSKYTPLDIGSTGKALDDMFARILRIDNNQGRSVDVVPSAVDQLATRGEFLYTPILMRGSVIDFGSTSDNVKTGIVMNVASNGDLDIMEYDATNTVHRSVKPNVVKPSTNLRRMTSDLKMYNIDGKLEKGYAGNIQGINEQDVLVGELGIDVISDWKGYMETTNITISNTHNLDLSKGTLAYAAQWDKIDFATLPKSTLEFRNWLQLSCKEKLI